MPRALARAAAKGDIKIYVAANRHLADLLDLADPVKAEQADAPDISAARKQLEDEIAQAIHDGEERGLAELEAGATMEGRQ